VRSLLIAVAATFAVAVAGCGSSTASAPSKLVSPAEFAAAVAEPGTVTINVLGPGTPFIAGTDLAIPADELEARKSELPPTSTRLAIYCMHGNTSAVAAETLAQLGYDDIVELRGGMAAWAASGRKLLAPSG
jgi:phage shock protein E